MWDVFWSKRFWAGGLWGGDEVTPTRRRVAWYSGLRRARRPHRSQRF